MSAQKRKVQTHCPVCRTPYQVPEKAVGHRAKCPKCDSTFRVAAPKPKLPTEDDILRWLNESDEDESTPQPRRWEMPSTPSTEQEPPPARISA